MTLAVQWTADSVRSTYALASVPEIAGRPAALAALWALCVATASDPGAAATVGQAFALCLAQHHTGMTCAGDAGSLVRNSEYWRNLPVEERSELSCTATHLTTTIAYLSRVLRAVYLSGVLDFGNVSLAFAWHPNRIWIFVPASPAHGQNTHILATRVFGEVDAFLLAAGCVPVGSIAATGCPAAPPPPPSPSSS